MQRSLSDGLQQHRLRTVVLEHNRVLRLVRNDLCEERHLALAFAIWTNPKLDHGKGIVDCAWPVHRLPKN